MFEDRLVRGDLESKDKIRYSAELCCNRLRGWVHSRLNMWQTDVSNMITKAFEIRDAGTFIAVIATLMESGDHQEHYLLRRSGYGLGRCVMLCRMDANGTGYQASYDAYGWGMARTMGTAHGHISEHWDKLQSGQVIDVQFILGETTKPKVSESVNYGFAVEGEQYP